MNNRDIIFGDGTGRDGTGSSVFHTIVSVANLFAAWNEFRRGKRRKKDVAVFELHLEDNIFALHNLLVTKTYVHDPYAAFFVCDPKRRHIHKASVGDRVLHQAIFRILYLIFDKHFIYDSYSSRVGKSTHAGVARLKDACRKVSKNWKSPTYALKCDVRRFFDSIDHDVLRKLISEKISDQDALWLIDCIFSSFEKEKGKGLPLGNVTSQLFANIYLNELDQFAKHSLGARHYFRYCDDFVIVHDDKVFLENALGEIKVFLKEHLLLNLHPHKVEIRKVGQGIDFLGYVVLPHAIILRTKMKNRILRKMKNISGKYQKGEVCEVSLKATTASYLGVLVHAKNKKLRAKIKRYLSR